MNRLRPLLVADAERAFLTKVDGIDIDLVATVGADNSRNRLFHSTRKDKTAIVVGMLANEVDAARSGEGDTLATETFLEFRMQKNCIYHFVNILNMVVLSKGCSGTRRPEDSGQLWLGESGYCCVSRHTALRRP